MQIKNKELLDTLKELLEDSEESSYKLGDLSDQDLLAEVDRMEQSEAAIAQPSKDKGDNP